MISNLLFSGIKATLMQYKVYLMLGAIIFILAGTVYGSIKIYGFGYDNCVNGIQHESGEDNDELEDEKDRIRSIPYDGYFAIERLQSVSA